MPTHRTHFRPDTYERATLDLVREAHAKLRALSASKPSSRTPRRPPTRPLGDHADAVPQ